MVLHCTNISITVFFFLVLFQYSPLNQNLFVSPALPLHEPMGNEMALPIPCIYSQ